MGRETGRPEKSKESWSARRGEVGFFVCLFVCFWGLFVCCCFLLLLLLLFCSELVGWSVFGGLVWFWGCFVVFFFFVFFFCRWFFVGVFLGGGGGEARGGRMWEPGEGGGFEGVDGRHSRLQQFYFTCPRQTPRYLRLVCLNA